ncbi:MULTISPECIES: septum formation initiator family protein [Oceanobacillus]|uniref:Septum formation initiator family protein n=1 Tax=Oceanobacillus kimchii TaxID=746691 RepID=A0ABQ5TCJ4_9BACI|nr:MULTISPECIES: septum formation initiator family protein [Oceanobacillus]MBT2599830.1 septum formation initiator family protein [Oceanobacillus sp. ISL-74]MBT2652720.1 septum formation initiator family protein [Oceanobacillus sp. ISL-73]MCT1577263.1 septum formation initiator family protein [Oceanobacillus kimchii]MCT2135333.1 septum formation initiator family protein [Oceanobacillus kimchii]OEH56597.1 cell division protein [Oceanobacillus sp. E9]
MANRKKNVTRLDSNYMQQHDVYIERQKRKKQRLVRRLVLFGVVIAIAFGSMTAYHVNQRATQSDKLEEYQQLEEELVQLKNQESNLEKEIKLLQDEDYVLDIARTNYFFSKEGEKIFKLPDEDPSY